MRKHRKFPEGRDVMISQKMKQMVEQSAAMSAMFTESKRLAAIYGAENVYDFGIGNPNVKAPASVNATAIEILQNMDSLKVHSYTQSLQSVFFQFTFQCLFLFNTRNGINYYGFILFHLIY